MPSNFRQTERKNPRNEGRKNPFACQKNAHDWIVEKNVLSPVALAEVQRYPRARTTRTERNGLSALAANDRT
jgi:hypothetical protein